MELTFYKITIKQMIMTKNKYLRINYQLKTKKRNMM